MSEYWKNIRTAAKTLNEGLKVTLKHVKQATGARKPIAPEEQNYFEQQNGLFTTQYPKEQLPVPDNGRYKLHNEIEDCIVCDKCAKVCPVDCIDIEPVRAVAEFGKTSDGTSKRIYAAKFDIDMAKCCFCGLCTTVCPTECLTMTNDYDFSAFDFAEHNFAFGEMTPLEILEKKKELEEFNRQKEEAKKAKAAEASATAKPAARPVARPRPKAAGAAEGGEKPKPAFRPKVQVKKPNTGIASPDETPKPVRPKVQMKPRVAPKTEGEAEASGTKPKPVRPKVQMKPKVKPAKENQDTDRAKPVRPKVQMKPRVAPKTEGEAAASGTKPKPVRPKVQVKPKFAPRTEEREGTEDKPKPVRPKVPVKPKIQARKSDKEENEGAKPVKPKIPMRPKVPTRKPNDDGAKDDGQIPE